MAMTGVEPLPCAACDLRARFGSELEHARDILANAEQRLLAAGTGRPDEGMDATLALLRTLTRTQRRIAALEHVMLEIDCVHGDTHAA